MSFDNRRKISESESGHPDPADLGTGPTVNSNTESGEEDDGVVETTTGNVFEDLGLPHAQTRLEKAELARVIRRVISIRGWKQREAAEVLGIAQSDVSDLIRGKLGRFSIERLDTLLRRLGVDIHIQMASRSEASNAVAPSQPLTNKPTDATSAPAYLARSNNSSRVETAWEQAAVGVQVSNPPSALTPNWRAAPDLSSVEDGSAALLRVPVQLVADMAATAGATALAGPFVWAWRFVASAVQHLRDPKVNGELPA